MPTWLAEDGIDELVSVILPGFLLPDRPHAATGGWLALEPVDSDARWLVKVDAGSVELGHDEKAAATAIGDASSLLLWSYGRPTTEVNLAGRPDVADAWQAACAFSRE